MHNFAEGFKEAAEKFQLEAGLEPSVELSSLDDRILIREAVQNGRIQEATHLVNQLHPELLDNDRYLFFHLQQLQLIELIRYVCVGLYNFFFLCGIRQPASADSHQNFLNSLRFLFILYTRIVKCVRPKVCFTHFRHRIHEVHIFDSKFIELNESFHTYPATDTLHKY